MFIKNNNKSYFFNHYSGNLYDIECNDNNYLEEYLNPEVFKFFSKYDYTILNKFNKIINMKDVWLQNKRFEDSINTMIADVSDLDYMRKRYESVSVATFCLTDQCNFRCKYCSYSGKNNLRRSHSTKKMNTQTLHSTLEYIIPRITSQGGQACRQINFYGGEPLVEFNSIKVAVNKIRKDSHDKISIGITTNGSLLNDDIIDYLIANNIITTFSIDGPQKIHDNNRVFINGGGTFKQVFNNIERFQRRNPGYFKRHVAFSVVIPGDVNIGDFYDFFHENRRLFDGQAFKVTYENTIGNESRIKVGSKTFIHQVMDFYCDKILEKPNEFNILDFLFANDLSAFNYKQRRNYGINNKVCSPGFTRLYVSTDGDFYVCESLDYFTKIGNAKDGFNIKNINKFVLDYVNIIRTMCSDCWAFPFCNLCFVHAIDCNGFSRDSLANICVGVRKYYAHLLSIYIKLNEKKGSKYLKQRFKLLPFN